MSTTVFDFAIIGAGAAGLHLALAMQKDAFFKDRKILILEKDEKNVDDRTWCYWETGTGQWDNLVSHQWNKGTVNTGNEEINLDMGEYSYKMVHSLDFYKYALGQLKNDPAFLWEKAEVQKVEAADSEVMIKTSENTFLARQVFDSRILAEDAEVMRSNTVLQHFKGWFIETEKAVFDPGSFLMMDFRLTWKDTSSFTYLLPFSENSALVEFTFFSPQLVDESVYDQMLKDYIEKYLKPGDYKITKTEAGIIPMSDYPYDKNNNSQVTQIGTAGSWVKPSSGYSFKNAERYSRRLVKNIIEGKNPSSGIYSPKHRFYDALFLNILKNKNHYGPSLFSSMYGKNSATQIFRFLDEETNLREDINIMASFDPWLFTKAILHKFLK
ncbi:lycopene cyclase family protein [Christiangramia sabulilitoris]|uniref:Lycopene cyclase n=1 Tax=Christiangramia sabulilitoris TaxID=2583991 RepID=A0A550HZJ5_9FLAO|nr:lycopene cyclase family protein [Christiangramia sabulilitoris]TRO64153.1 lycopene cyclase [Christiangramia sabulilitoris]